MLDLRGRHRPGRHRPDRPLLLTQGLPQVEAPETKRVRGQSLAEVRELSPAESYGCRARSARQTKRRRTGSPLRLQQVRLAGQGGGGTAAAEAAERSVRGDDAMTGYLGCERIPLKRLSDRLRRTAADAAGQLPVGDRLAARHVEELQVDAQTEGREALRVDDLRKPFAFIAQLHHEELLALVKRLQEKSVPFPQVLRQQFPLVEPHEFALVAVDERSAPLRRRVEVHVLHAPHVGDEDDETAQPVIGHRESRLLLHLAERADVRRLARLELAADTDPLVLVLVVLLLRPVQNEIPTVLLKIAQRGFPSAKIRFHDVGLYQIHGLLLKINHLPSHRPGAIRKC